MTTKTTTRTVDVVSKEEWKALVKAQELNRTQLLRSGMGTGTGTGTGTEESSQFFTLHQDKHGELFSHEDVTWDINASVLCVVEIKNGQIVSVDSSFSYSFTGGTGIGDYGQYHNVMLQGNTFMGSTSGVYSNYSEQIQDDYYDFYNSVSTASATLHGIGFSIGGNTVDEEGNPISFSYWSAIMDIRLACGATYDPFHNSVSINPSISTF